MDDEIVVSFEAENQKRTHMIVPWLIKNLASGPPSNFPAKVVGLGADQAAQTPYRSLPSRMEDLGDSLGQAYEKASKPLTRVLIRGWVDSYSVWAIVFGFTDPDRWAPGDHRQPFLTLIVQGGARQRIMGIDAANRMLLNLASEAPDIRLRWLKSPPSAVDLGRFSDLANINIDAVRVTSTRLQGGDGFSSGRVQVFDTATISPIRQTDDHLTPPPKVRSAGAPQSKIEQPASRDRVTELPVRAAVRSPVPSDHPTFWRKLVHDLTVQTIAGIVTGVILLVIGAVLFGSR